MKPKKKKNDTDKEYLLQFRPSQMDDIDPTKKTKFNDKSLKNAYLIDLMDCLLMKFYHRKSNEFNLLADILKKRYGTNYNHYIDYLQYRGHIVMFNNYIAGVKARSYRLDSAITDQVISRVKNTDTVLLKKHNKFALMAITTKDGLIESEVKKKMVTDAKLVKVDYDRAIAILNSITDLKGKVHAYNINRQCIEKIKSNLIYAHFDSYGRMHTNFTVLKSTIRKTCLSINGDPLTELDIDNSQPLFLTKLIADTMASDTLPVHVDVDEYQLFKTLTINGKLYEYILRETQMKEKKEVKTFVYKVLFGKNKPTIDDLVFSYMFPTIHQFIKDYKYKSGNSYDKCNDYKLLAHQLQRSESNLIYNVIIKEIMINHPEIPIVSIHDSIMFPRKYNEVVGEIFTRNIKKEFNLI